MSSEALQQVIGRAVVDAGFRQQLIDSARSACAEYDLTEDELNALEALDAESLKSFVGSLDERITKSGGRGFI
ncbi:Franean1_4349 family RiPP [Candidatus Gracilibacteria bacterium]|nr:Franean1_4349 family RiPP [Candidatus Gracilibacteria bacterium]